MSEEQTETTFIRGVPSANTVSRLYFKVDRSQEETTATAQQSTSYLHRLDVLKPCYLLIHEKIPSPGWNQDEFKVTSALICSELIKVCSNNVALFLFRNTSVLTDRCSSLCPPVPVLFEAGSQASPSVCFCGSSDGMF